jgi:hypothetical protein
MNGLPKLRFSFSNSTSYASPRVFFIVIVAGFSAACVPLPFEWQDIPATNGRVVDAVSSEPIPGSTVVLTAFDTDKSIRLKTNEKGEFQSDRIWHWKVLLWRINPGETGFAIQDSQSYSAGASIVARGYDPSYRRISGRGVVEMKTINLQRASDDQRSLSTKCPDPLVRCFTVLSQRSR